LLGYHAIGCQEAEVVVRDLATLMHTRNEIGSLKKL
jgi:hypothetical protein